MAKKKAATMAPKEESLERRGTRATVEKLEADAEIAKEQARILKGGGPGPIGGQHNKVTAASIKRRAHAHMAQSRKHSALAATLRGDAQAIMRMKHEAIALMHAETCEIENAEAEEILGQRKAKK